MANVKISALPEATQVTNSDYTVIDDGVTTKKIAFVNALTDFLNVIYPVGSIYMSVNSTSPATLFGGTWVQITDTFLLASGSSYTAGSTGGEAKHVLTKNEMPSHTHAVYGVKASSSNETPIRIQTQDDGNMVLYASSGTPLWNSGTSSSDIKGYRSVTIGENGTSGSTGGGNEHNNMPPYLAVYMWKRTA